jgi:hypothetical protein
VYLELRMNELAATADPQVSSAIRMMIGIGIPRKNRSIERMVDLRSVRVVG